jgi:3-mercaptopyruvate sulfurtransferase SseA
VARALMERGFHLVRPLAGGLDGWVEAGYVVDSETDVPELIAIRPAGESR